MEEAAKNGHREAMDYIAVRYYKGLGIPQSFKKSKNWALKAAQSGNPNSMHLLGVLHTTGHNIKEDFKRAHMWFDLAVQHGYKKNDTFSVKSYMTVDEVQKAKVMAEKCNKSQFRNC